MRILAVAAAISTVVAGTAHYTRAVEIVQVQLGYFNNVFKEQQQLSEPASTFVERWYDRCRKTGDADIFHEFPGSVKADTKGLPLLWRVLSTPEGTVFEDPRGRDGRVGTGGGYPPARYT